MRESAKAAEKRFELRLEARLKAMGFMNGSPQERWRMYTQVITQAMWDGLRTNYPERWARAMADYERLRQRVMSGDLVV